MPENILVVEYEPRYTDRVRQALAGQALVPQFAKDGDEAIRALDADPPRLIVLSSVVPKISTAELIRAIRGRKPLAETPILLTVSGYNGKSPRQDAQRMGASDILPKPYSESEFLGKVQQMLGIRVETPPQWATADLAGSQLTSNEIFGDLLQDEQAAPAGARKSMSKPKDDLDKMLADTLAGVLPQKKKDPAAAAAAKPAPAPAPAPAPPPPAPTPVAPPPPAAAEAPKPKTASSPDLEKRLQDTLSGLEKSARRPSQNAPTVPGTMPTPAPRPTPVPPAPPAAARTPTDPGATPAGTAVPEAKRYNTERLPVFKPEKVVSSSPVFPAAAPEPAKVEEEEPADGVRFGQYVLIEKIATGGMAEVWKARMRGVEGFQKIVAIKKILPHLSDNQDFIEMFIDEAKLAAQLNHNNIIHIYDLGKITNSYYIAMEYIDGHDLKTILRRGEERGQPMGVELALFIASKVASALDYAHRKRDFEDRDMGLVHRDVSPQNVLISQEGDIKLCDFGIAKAASKASHTQAGALKGKLQYMSPEQAWGRHIDKRSDVFALATVLFELLTGNKLFTGDNELSILEQVREARVTPPSETNDEVTPEIDKVVLKALQKDPAQRYQTAGEMARDLDQILYSFKPTPTSADLAIYMHRIWSPEPIAAPEPEPLPIPEPAKTMAVPLPVIAPAPAHPVAAAPVAPAPAAIPTVADYGHHEEKKKSLVPLIAIGAVVLLALVVGGWYAMSKRGATAAPAQVAGTNTAAPATAAPATTAVASGTLAPVPAPGTVAPVTNSVDQTAVDAEVAKRLAAERQKYLEQQQRAAAAANPAATTPARPTPAPVTQTQAPAVAQTQTQAPPPVQTQTQAPAPVVETPRPAPVQEQPAPAAAPARAREGDLIPVGTDGLTPPKLVKRGSVPYPPIAKINRVEGTVVLSVLVSETGQVLETRVLRGVTKAVGLNEAAEQTMRRSTFSPGTKDGVRVKSWITVPVEFKL